MKLTLLKTLFLSAATCIFCSVATGEEKKVVKIGSALSLTGQYASYGHDILNGMQIALDELKADAQNTIIFQLVLEDTKSESVQTINAFRKLINIDKVNVLLGSDTSSNTMAGATLAQQFQVPLIAPAATAKEVTDAGDYVSKVCFSDDFQGKLMAQYAFDDLRYRTAAILVDNSSEYSTEIAKYFKKSFEERGGRVIDQAFAYTGNDSDFKSLLIKIKRAKPDFVFLPGYYGDVANILKQAQVLSFNIPFVGCDGWDSPNLQSLMGEKKLDYFISSHYASDDEDPLVTSFVRKFKERFNKVPGTMSALGYDAVHIIANAVGRAKDLSPRSIKEAINSVEKFKGVTGIISIDKDGNTTKTGTIMHVTNSGNTFVKRIVPKSLD